MFSRSTAADPQENQQQTEQAGAGQQQSGYGLHGGVVGRHDREGRQVVAGQILECNVVVAGGRIGVGDYD